MANREFKDISKTISFENNSVFKLDELKEKLSFLEKIGMTIEQMGGEGIAIKVLKDGSLKIFPKEADAAYHGLENIKGCNISYMGEYICLLNNEIAGGTYYNFYSDLKDKSPK
jgi:hypothetical protein